MFGGGHFKKKIDKKARKAEAKRENQSGGNHQGGAKKDAPPVGQLAKKQQQQPQSRNRSTLKGPVVAPGNLGPATRDSGNDRHSVPFANKRDEKAYLSRLPRGARQALEGSQEGGNNSASQQQQIAKPQRPGNKNIGANSKAQKRQFAKAHGEDLLDQFRSKLKSSTFRLLNEQLYTSPNAFASQLLRDPATFNDYHTGYRVQLAQWPMDPNKLIIEALLGDRKGRFLANKSKSAPGAIPLNFVVADMGCGDAHIAAALVPMGYKVHAFDFCAVNSYVTVASSTQVPLADKSVDVCIFSLSLMATDYFDSLVEAFRVLKPGRLLKIVEVRSRVPHPNALAELVERIGFTCDWFDVAGDYFIAFDFMKRADQEHPNKNPAHHPADVLLSSLYKKR